MLSRAGHAKRPFYANGQPNAKRQKTVASWAARTQRSFLNNPPDPIRDAPPDWSDSDGDMASVEFGLSDLDAEAESTESEQESDVEDCDHEAFDVECYDMGDVDLTACALATLTKEQITTLRKCAESADYYRFLGLRRGCSERELRQHYGKLAKLRQDDQELNVLKEAYYILRDPQLRQCYTSFLPRSQHLYFPMNQPQSVVESYLKERAPYWDKIKYETVSPISLRGLAALRDWRGSRDFFRRLKESFARQRTYPRLRKAPRERSSLERSERKRERLLQNIER